MKNSDFEKLRKIRWMFDPSLLDSSLNISRRISDDTKKQLNLSKRKK